MSKGQRIQGLAAVVALASATSPPLPPDIAEGGEAASELPPLPDAPPESISAELEFVESEVLAENRTLRAKVERLERELSAMRMGAAPVRDARRRAVFDASVPLLVDGEGVVFAPGDLVPAHIDPATLPHGAVRHLIEEG